MKPELVIRSSCHKSIYPENIIKDDWCCAPKISEKNMCNSGNPVFDVHLFSCRLQINNLARMEINRLSRPLSCFEWTSKD